MSAKETPQLSDPNPQEADQAKPVTMADNADHFRRGHMTWGRPPQVTFRAGPLPRDEGLARLMAMPPYPQPAQPQVRGSTASGLDQPLVGFGAEAAKAGLTPSVKPARPVDPVASMPAPSPVFGGSLVPGVGNTLTPALKTPLSAPVRAPVPTAVPEPVASAKVSQPQTEPVLEERFEMPPIVVTAPRKAAHVTAKPRTAAKRAKVPLLLIVAVVLLGAVCAGVWWGQKEGWVMPSVPQNTPVASAPAVTEVVVAPATADVAEVDAVTQIEPVIESVAEPATAPVATIAEAQNPVPQPRPMISDSEMPVQPKGPVPYQSVTQQLNAPTVAQSGPADPNAPISTRPQNLD